MRTVTFIFCCLASALVQSALGFSSDGSSLVRSLDKSSALTNAAIVVTASFTNGGTETLNGLFYTEQLPSGLEVTPLNVTVAGQSITNYSMDYGQDGDVYAGCTPCRWVLELPPNFLETNSIAPGAGVQITYSVTSPAAGSYALKEFSWSGSNLGSTNAVFGYSESAAQQSLTFVSNVPAPMLSIAISGNGAVLLQGSGMPGLTYRFESSESLTGTSWTTAGSAAAQPDGTFHYSEPVSQVGSARFYRVVYP